MKKRVKKDSVKPTPHKQSGVMYFNLGRVLRENNRMYMFKKFLENID